MLDLNSTQNKRCDAPSRIAKQSDPTTTSNRIVACLKRRTTGYDEPPRFGGAGVALIRTKAERSKAVTKLNGGTVRENTKTTITSNNVVLTDPLNRFLNHGVRHT